MTKCLFIANIFPPMGGSGVQRSAKFVKYLREFDVEPYVFTRAYDQGISDETLLSEIPKDIHIKRTKPYDYTQWKGIFEIPGKVIARKLLIPDGEVTWYKRNMKQAEAMIEKHQIDVIFSTSYPYSDHLLAMELKKKYPHIPWIADFRDEWSMNPYIIDKGYGSYRRNKEKKMEEAIARHCDYFIANTRIMHENFLSMYPFLQEKSAVITNGFDGVDFDCFDKQYKGQDKFIIVHPGVIYGNRRIDKVLKAMKELVDEGHMNQEDIVFRLIGDIKDDQMIQIADQFSLGSIVDCPGYMSHTDTIQALLDSEVLLLLLREGEGGRNIAPGKIYEYINANRPILALAPKDGVSADIIRDTNTGIICDTINVSEIKEGLLKLYNDWKEKKVQMDTNWSEVAKFERRELTRRLAKIMKDCSVRG